MSLKHKLPYWRNKRNLTQRELAEKVCERRKGFLRFNWQ